MGATAGRDLKRGVLAVLTSGTSEIKSGGGVYGDETVADTLFPKAINDWALEGRQGERAAADEKVAAEKTALDNARPPPTVDLTDQTLRAARRSQLLRSYQGVTRPSSLGMKKPGG